MWASFALTASLLACAKSEGDGLSARAKDRVALEAIVSADVKLDRELKAADDASARGEDDLAALLLERNAAPAADGALALAMASEVTTPWGRARREDLLAVLRDRKTQIPRYAAALRGTDLNEKLAAAESQVELQKRAIHAVESVSAIESEGP